MLKLKVSFGIGGTPLYFYFTTDKALKSGEVETKGNIRTINKLTDWAHGECGTYVLKHYKAEMVGFHSMAFVD